MPRWVRTGVSRAQRGACAESQARGAGTRAAWKKEVIGRRRVRHTRMSEGIGVAVARWKLRRGRTEEHQASGTAGERSVHQTAKGEVNRRLPLGVHLKLGRPGRHSRRVKCLTSSKPHDFESPSNPWIGIPHRTAATRPLRQAPGRPRPGPTPSARSPRVDAFAMPPPGSSKKKKGKKSKEKRGGGVGVGGGSGIDSLVESGNEHLAFERIDEGLADLKRACALAPDNPVAADAYGMALAEFGDPDDAIGTLKRAAQLRPNEGFEKFMYLGQLLDDAAAAATCTRQGLAIIEHQASLGDLDADERLCGACCALVEQLLAAADDVEDVADECDALLRRAAEADVTSAEPMQAMASLRSLQGRTEEALEALRRSVATWRSRRGGWDVDPDDAAHADDEAALEIEGEYEVSFEFRFETAKLLLELDENTEEAVMVLEELLNERDNVVDVWHLLALANHGACNFDRALELLDHAEALNEKQGGAEHVIADLMELRSAVTESKEKWEEDVGADHKMGGEDDE